MPSNEHVVLPKGQPARRYSPLAEGDDLSMESPYATLYLPFRNEAERIMRALAVDVVQKRGQIRRDLLNWDPRILVPEYGLHDETVKHLHGAALYGMEIEVCSVRAPMLATELTLHHIS